MKLCNGTANECRQTRCLPRLCGGLIEAAPSALRSATCKRVVSPAYAGASLKRCLVVADDAALRRCLPRLCGGLIEAMLGSASARRRKKLSPPLMRGPH